MKLFLEFFRIEQIRTLLLLFLLLISGTLQEANFDPNDCYEPGTIFEENEKNLGFCPCKYGYYGPYCFDIFDCVIGDLRTDNCSREFRNDYDLQWRCAASKKDIVKICTCPDGFRGETCEFILENTFSTYLETVKQSQKFFEVVYNKSHSVLRLAASTVCRKVLEYRRVIMFFIFLIILELAWRNMKRTRRGCKLNRKFVETENFKNPNFQYFQLNHNDFSNLESDLPKKQKLEDVEEKGFQPTTVAQISEAQEDNKVHRPCLHI